MSRSGARWWPAAGVGILAGFLSGLFGIGGGILIVPGLVLLLKMEQRLAHGTSLGAVLPIAASGLLGFALSDAVDWTAGSLIVSGAVIGVTFGARLLSRLPERALRLSFSGLLVATAIRLLLETPSASGRGSLHVWSALALVAIGLVSGMLAGLLGVGGGIVIIPALVVFFSVPDAVAKGTSLFVILPTAVAGTWSNRRLGNVDLEVAAVVGLAGAAAAFGGSRLAIHMDPRLSSILFAVLLLAVSIRLVIARTVTPRPGSPRLQP